MQSSGMSTSQFATFLFANLLLYSCWIVLSSFAGTRRPPGSSFPFFLLGYATAGICWVAFGYKALGWGTAAVTRSDTLLILVAGACACSGTMFFYRALSVSADANRSVVYVVAASYPAVTFGLANIAGACCTAGPFRIEAVAQFATRLGYDPGNTGKNVGLAIVLIGSVLIAGFTKRP